MKQAISTTFTVLVTATILGYTLSIIAGAILFYYSAPAF